MATRARSHQAPDRIVRDPRVLDGEPTVQGTRVPVRSIILAHQYYGDVARVCQAYPSLDRAAVEEALAFYRANLAEIDRYIAENEAELD